MIPIEHAPRLVLGLPSDAPADAATPAFARASRRLKAAPNAPFEIKDLTTALSHIEGHAQDASFFEYKVPADPSVLTSSGGLDGDSAARESLSRSVEAVLTWNWLEAVDLAKDVLRQTQDEALRDEALNVLAAGHAMLGNTEAAIAALQQAVEGQWNYALQQNLGVLAVDHDPALAAHQATFWLDAAETREDRERAITLVLNTWGQLDADDDDDEWDLPERIRDSFRLALGQDLSHDTFALLGLFLARHDDQWVAQASHWSSSPHVTSETAGMILARAEGFEQYMDFLVATVTSTHEETVRARNGMISSLIDSMWQEDSAMGAAGFAMALIDGGLPCTSINYALLRILTVQEIVLYFRDNDGEPKDDFVTWLHDAGSYLRDIEDTELRDSFQGLYGSVVAMYALQFVIKRDAEFQSFSTSLITVHDMSRRWTTRRRLNKYEARKLAVATKQWAETTSVMIRRLRDLGLQEPEIVGFLDDLSRQQTTVRAMSDEILRELS